MEAGIKSANGLLALLDSDPDNLFIVLTARELNPTLHIISRSEDVSSDKKILQAGADRVISPFTSAGKQIAANVLTATGKSSLMAEIPTGPHSSPRWITVKEGSLTAEETITAYSAKTGIQIIGHRRNGHDTIFPDPDTGLKIADMLLVINGERQMEKESLQQPLEPPKVVIVDDNPAILRLYTRLFRKAGFHPVTATNGQEGLDLILREKPAAGVIDFMLPALSGIEVCERVREVEACKEVKLVLFTADGHPDIRRRALGSGADEVVVKSSNASEIIETVINIIRKDQMARVMPSLAQKTFIDG